MTTPYDVSGHVPSRKSRAINAALRPTIKQLSRVLPGSPAGLRLTRVAIEQGCVRAGFDKVPHTVVRERTESDQVRGEWVGPSARPGERVLLYAHGSAYAVCSTRTHRRFVAALARRTERRAFSLDYRLGPEHAFPAAHDDMVRAYLWLLARGHHPEDILVAGDSAGGHLSLSLCGELRRLGMAMPAGLILFSPLVDGSFDTAAAAYRLSNDPVVVPRFARRVIGHYFRTAQRDDPRYDVRHDVGPDLPPTLVVAGGAEMMRGDAEAWGRLQAEAGGHCEVQIWPRQVHVFPLFGLVPEARLAMVEVQRFVAQLDDASLDSDVG